jgi:tellurite resistance protein TerC
MNGSLFTLELLHFFFRSCSSQSQRTRYKEALKWSAFWISLGLAFGFYIYLSRGIDSALYMRPAGIIEESLSVDNLMVFLL